MIKKLIPFMSDSSGTEVQERQNEPEDEEPSVEDADESSVQDVAHINRNLITPEVMLRDKHFYKVGEKYTRTYFVKKWPNDPDKYFLDNVVTMSQFRNTISIYVDPFNKEEALRYLKGQSQRAQDILSEESGLLSSMQREETLKETIAVFNALDNSDTNLFEVSLYITVKADSEQELNSKCRELQRRFKTDAGIYLAEAYQEHEAGFQSNTPTMNDKLSQHNHEMPGGAVGFMNPFTTTSVMEHEEGIDYGKHEYSNAPIFVDRFARETGYNEIVAGTIGSGKSFSSALTLLRTKAKHGDDVEIFILDPVAGFKPVQLALDGDIINPVDTQLNPFKLEKTEDTDNISYDPLSLQRKKVMDFFTMFYEMTGSNLSSEKNGILSEAVKHTYREKGITEDISTHSKESPTIQTLFDVLDNMVEEPTNYSAVEDEKVLEDQKRIAGEIRNDLRPFGEGAQLDNLASESNLDFSSNDTHWINLNTVEGTSQRGLLMYTFISQIYEETKNNDKKTLIYIDEAHILMKHAQTLDFITQIVRHSRHNDLGITFITQEIDDFFNNEQAKAIAGQCSIKRFQKIDGGITPEVAEEYLDLNEQEQQYIREAQAGGEHGYSTALLEVDDYGTIPLRIEASEFEQKLIDFELGEDGDAAEGSEEAKKDKEKEDIKREIERVEQEATDAEETDGFDALKEE